jgi:hypothetical protein
MDGKAGHIWTVFFGEQESPCIIIAAHEKHFNVLRLAAEPKWPVNVEVHTLMGKTYYANPEFLTYKFEADFVREKDEITRDSWQNLQQELADALGLYLETPEPAEEPEPAERFRLLAEVKIDPDELAATVQDLDANLKRLADEVRRLETENAVLTATRDLYLQEYLRLLQGIIQHNAQEGPKS